MNFDSQLSSPEIQRQIHQNYQNRQLMAEASKMQLGSTAKQIAYNLYDEIVKYQENLPDSEDVIMMLVQFNQSIPIRVTQIGYIGYNLICFFGEGTNGKPLELIQHIQQLNFLLSVSPKPEPDVPKRQIGFVGQID